MQLADDLPTLQQAMEQVMERIGKDPTIDRHLVEVREKYLGRDDFTVKAMTLWSKMGGALCSWLHDITQLQQLSNI